MRKSIHSDTRFKRRSKPDSSSSSSLSSPPQVVSPLQSILDYELRTGIPPGWINYAISKSGPSGYWSRLERGEVPLDEDFYRGWGRELHDPVRWQEFYQREQQKKSPHPLSEKNIVPPVPKIDCEWLFNDMMTSSVGTDPWMFPALNTLKESGQYIVAALSNTIVFPPGHELHSADFFADPMRRIFDVFISSAHVGFRKPEPGIYKLALEAVDKFARQQGAGSSAATAGSGREAGVEPHDVLFLDDIGTNLSAARKQGFRTIRVPMGRAYEAVEELERATGLKLAGDHPKVPIKAENTTAKAKI